MLDFMDRFRQEDCGCRYDAATGRSVRTCPEHCLEETAQRAQAEAWQPATVARVLCKMAEKLEVADVVHLLLAERCTDKGCACYEAGYRAAQETVSDWHRPAGA